MAVLEAERGKETVSRITAKYEISDTTLRQWQKQLLRRECSDEMPTVKKKKESSPDSETAEDLRAEVIRLRGENETQADLLHQARLEREVLT